MVGRLHVEGQVQQPGAVGACRAELGRGGDRRLGGVVGVEAPDGIFFQVGDRDRRRLDVEQVGGECLDVALRYPRCAEIGVDVAGQHVLGLHGSQGVDIAGILRAGAFGGGELGPDVAGEIGVGGLPGSGFRVGEDQVAQLGDDLCFRLAVEGADERQIDRAALVEGDEQPFLGAADVRDGRGLADHVLGHDGGLGRLAGHLVVILQRHDEHGVRVFAGTSPGWACGG